MSLNKASQPNYQSHMILEQIDKAFKNVNFICRDYFQRVKITEGLLKVGQINKLPQSYKNFNNYKGQEQFMKTSTLNNENSVIQINQKNSSSLPVPQYVKKPSPKPQNSNPPPPSSNKHFIISHNLLKQNIPPPPKAPLSPYFTFYKQKKDLIKEQFPDMSVTEISSAAAKVWKSLSDQQKGPYTKKYCQEKRNYQEKMSQYAKKYPDYKEMLKKAAVITKK